MESGNLYFYCQANLKNIVISNIEPLQIFEQGSDALARFTDCGGGVYMDRGVGLEGRDR